MSIISESENIATMTANHYERILLERDELAALLAAEKATRNSIIEKGVKTERERDEARHKLELCMAANSDVARIAKERDEARELLANALVRGDLALEETKKAQDALSWSDIQDKREMQRERDEAREAIREAWFAMDEADGTERMITWQNKNANILEGAK
jgi:hypothetical protein